MMDPAADDLMTASIGRSPRNDPDPPGPHQADLHGLPLDNATKPASTEAQLRQAGAEGHNPTNKTRAQGVSLISPWFVDSQATRDFI